jgi:acetylornithine deacetylase/succinyl-diaminopimelate desuccinylase-like protein
MSAVLDHLAANASRHADELCAYLRFPSVSAQEKHAPDLRAAADWVASRLGGLGLETTLHETAGHPIVVARTVPHDPAKPTFLVYGHYDVQPPEPFELWKTPPFEPRIEDGNVYARGSCDNKGQHLAHIHAVEAYVRTGTPLPCNLTFLIEGEEEVGSTHLYSFLPAHKDLLARACQALVDTTLADPLPMCRVYTLGTRDPQATTTSLVGLVASGGDPVCSHPRRSPCIGR